METLTTTIVALISVILGWFLSDFSQKRINKRQNHLYWIKEVRLEAAKLLSAMNDMNNSIRDYKQYCQSPNSSNPEVERFKDLTEKHLQANVSLLTEVGIGFKFLLNHKVNKERKLLDEIIMYQQFILSENYSAAVKKHSELLILFEEFIKSEFVKYN